MRVKAIFLFCLLITSVCLADHLYLAQSKKSVELEEQIYEDRLDDVEDILTGKSELTEKQYDQLRKETLDAINALETLKNRLIQKIQRSSGEGKKELEIELVHVNEIIHRAQLQLQIINKEKIHIRAKGLLTVQMPLYQVITLRKAYTDSLDRSKAIFDQTHYNISSITQMMVGKQAIIFWTIVLLVILVKYIFGLFIRKRWGYLEEGSLSYLRKIRALITIVAVDSILPLILLYILGYLVYLNDGFVTSASNLLSFFILIASLVIPIRFVTAFFHPSHFEWALCHIEKKRAATLSRRVSILLVFIVIRCNLTFFSDQAEGIQSLIFISQALMTFQLFFVLQVTTLSFFYRYVLMIIAITNPLCIFLGLNTLANLLLVGTLATVLIILVLKAIHYLIKQGVVFFITRHHALIGKVNFGEKSLQILTHWVNAFLIVILFLIGLYFTMIAWGIERAYLNDVGARLLFGFSIGSYTFSLLNILLGVVVFLFFFSLTRYLQNLLAKHVFPYTTLDSGLKHALKTTAGYVGFFITIVLTIKTVGFDLSSILFVLGGLSVGIGLGLQPIVTNFISGIIMLLERPVKIGDVIELQGEYGIVKRINVRTTEVETLDKSSVLFPNSHIINNVVKNWTKHDRMRRCEIAIGVGVHSDTKLVEQVLIQCALKHPKVSKELSPTVLFHDFGESTLLFLLKFYIDEVIENYTICAQLRHIIYQEMAQHHITLPFPQQDIHFDSAFIEAISKKNKE